MSLAAGQFLSTFKILKQLGAGGMGEIYLAEDTTLGRQVTLKLLPPDFAADPDRMRRFTYEAKAASALNHPNVAQIYELREANGLHFIIMEYVQGKTLDAEYSERRPDPQNMIDVAVQIADVLEDAHSKGILHRDIKPTNIMLNSRGQVKVLDFGLAKITAAAGSAGGDSSFNTVTQTQPGKVFGTAPYMSPEQALGRVPDGRSDIYSLGVTLYQLATSRLPFSGNTSNELLDQILHAQPEPISRYTYNIPQELERIIRKCMEKDSARRYQNAHDLKIDLMNLKRDMQSTTTGPATSQYRLRRSSSPLLLAVLAAAAILALGLLLYYRAAAPHGKAIRSIAVLPFVNSSKDSKAEFLSDGITESIINSLSQLNQLRVMARSTVFTYKNKQVDPRKVGRDLNVDAVVTGDVLPQGDTLIVRANLVDVSDGAQIWGEQYDEKMANVLSIQSDISKKISDKLRFALTGEEEQRIAKQYTVNSDAYEFYIQGRYYWNKRSEDGLKKAIGFFEQALAKDPNYALAYAGLADSYASLGFAYDAGASAPREIMPKAEEAALKSLELDPTLAEGHTSLAFVRLNYDWDWPAAEREFKEAIRLNPNYSNAHHWYSHYLTAMGRTDDSLAESKRSLQIDPLSRIINVHLGWHYLFAHQYDLSIEQLKKAIEMNEFDWQAHWYLGLAYAQKSNHAQAVDELQKAFSLMKDSPEIKGELGYVYGLSGNRDSALTSLNELKDLSTRKYVSPYLIAEIYVSLNDLDHAFEWLQKAYDARSDALVYLKVDPKLDPLRKDPRFADLLRKMKL